MRGCRVRAYLGGFREIAELIASLADAVHFAHSRGVLHRDLKPGNILFDDAGRPYVSDFGLARFTELADETLPATKSLRLEGTPQFLAPEAVAGGARDVTIAGDIYGLGSILYEVLTGQPPHTGESLAALLKKIVEQEPLPPSTLAPEVPRDLEVICLKCLEKETVRRYGSAAELANDLRLWLARRPINARPVGARERVWKWAKRNPVTAALGSVLLLALVAGGVALHRSHRKLEHALANSRVALRESLLAQARFQRATGRTGQRFETIELLRRASALGHSEAVAAELRTEITAALALPDFRILSRWPVFVRHYEAKIAFSSDLERYASAVPEGGFGIFSTESRAPLRRFAGDTNNPALQFSFSEDGHWIAATFQDGHAEVHSLVSNAPPLRWPGKAKARTTLEFAPDSSAVVIPVDGCGLVWCDLATAKESEFLPNLDRPDVVRFNPNGKLLVIGRGARCELWRVAEKSQLWSQLLSNRVSAVAWAPDSRHIAAASAGRESSRKIRYGIVVLDSSDGTVSALDKRHERSIEQLAFDGNSIITVAWDGQLVWQDSR